MADELFLPVGFYTYTFAFDGTSLPTGAAMTGCGIVTNASTPLATAQALRGEFLSRLSPFQPSTVNLKSTYVRYGSDDGTGLSATDFTQGTGASSSAPASPGVALLIRHQTGLGGRRGRGRWFMPGVLEPQVDGAGTVLSTFVTSVNAALATMLTNLSTQGIPLAVGHRYPALQTTGRLAPNVIIESRLDSRLATQRKRQRR